MEKVIPIVKSWSFSRYNDYKTCPLKFRLKHLDKIAEPPNAAMQRGSDIDKMVEDYIVGRSARLPKEVLGLRAEISMLRKLYKKAGLTQMTVQETWALTKTWGRTVWNDWDGCWLRVKLDCAHQEGDTLIMTDWKTGKMRPQKVEEYKEQLELYATCALLLHPSMTRVRVRLGFLDHDAFYPGADEPTIEYVQADLKGLMKTWEKRVRPMFADKRFAPKANDGCRWCWYGQGKKADGGPGLCRY